MDLGTFREVEMARCYLRLGQKPEGRCDLLSHQFVYFDWITPN